MNPDQLAIPPLNSPAVINDPFPVLDDLRREAPVYWSNDLKGYVLTRYDDVKRALREPSLSVEKIEPFVANHAQDSHAGIDSLGKVLSDWMVFKDPPRHTRLRRALKDAFMPRDIQAMEPRVAAVVAELLQPMDRDGTFDAIADFAFLLPAYVIADLFGLPRSEAPNLKSWSHDLGKFVLNGIDAEDRFGAAGRAVEAMTLRFRQLVREHQSSPRDDFTTHLITHGGELTEDEMVHTLVLVLWAGYETTTNLIGTALWTLAQQPETAERLRTHPDLIETAVEECLRLNAPAHMLVRIATKPVRFGDMEIAPGQRLFPVINAANRDPAMFADADSLDLSRHKVRHVAFGHGIHICLGAPLARLEARMALAGVLRHFAHFELIEDEPVWRQDIIMRGLVRLPLRYRLAPSSVD